MEYRRRHRCTSDTKENKVVFKERDKRFIGNFLFSGVTLITITAVGFELEGFILSVLNRSSIHVRGIIGGNAVGTLGR